LIKNNLRFHIPDLWLLKEWHPYTAKPAGSGKQQTVARGNFSLEGKELHMSPAAGGDPNGDVQRHMRMRRHTNPHNRSSCSDLPQSWQGKAQLFFP